MGADFAPHVPPMPRYELHAEGKRMAHGSLMAVMSALVVLYDVKPTRGEFEVAMSMSVDGDVIFGDGAGAEYIVSRVS
jgi:hypothetical protein